MNPFETSPEQHSETKNQSAVFVWLAMCGQFGRKAANDPKCYKAGYARENYAPADDRTRLVCDSVFAIPNGTQLTGGERQGAILVGQGVKSGMPDICVPVLMQKRVTSAVIVMHPCGWVEMKAPKGVLSENQEKRIELLKRLGHWVTVEIGWLNTTSAIADYLEL